MSVIDVHHSRKMLLARTSVRSLLEPVRQQELPVDRILPPVGICAFRATCKASVCRNDRNDPACSGSKGH
jgi:hypothetical protein